MSNWLRKAQAGDADSGIQDHDKVNLERNIALEQEAINIYRGQMEKARPHIKKLLEHVISEELEHMHEFEKQLQDLEKPLEESDLEQPK